MKDFDYSIINLINEFSRFAKLYEEDLYKNRQRYAEDFPGAELPRHLKEDFNLSHALTCICQEIYEVNKRLPDE